MATYSKKWSASQIQDQMTIVTRKINEVKSRMSETKADYSDTGYAKELERRLKPYQERLTELRNITKQWHNATQQPVTQLRETHFPTAAPGSNAALQAEMHAARVLNRGKLSHDAALKLFDMEPSPTRTILIEEAMASGALTAEATEGQIRSRDEVYRLTVKNAEYADTAIHALNSRAQGIDHIINTPAAVELSATQKVDVCHVPGSNVTYETDGSVELWNESGK